MTTKSWGPYVWTFIHTFTHKIDNTFYMNNKNEVLSLLFAICSNLPCHICEEHAKSYLKKVNKNMIRTKSDLIRFFKDFHNNVNRRLRKAQFNNIEQYDNYSLYNTFINFRTAYTSNYHLRDKFHKTLSRKNIVKNINKFISSNKTKFGYT